MLGLCFFFFKQKTAYEMRISDWSSDVCSSDLIGRGRRNRRIFLGLRAPDPRPAAAVNGQRTLHPTPHANSPDRQNSLHRRYFLTPFNIRAAALDDGASLRSEEHTSELQSLMRISYAVFCLKKKKN